jgi:hypothetical protein
MKRIKRFFALVLQSLNPRYALTLCEKSLGSAVLFFLLLLLVGFLCAGVLAVPQFFFIKEDVSEGLLAINTFHIDVDFETTKPISIPSHDPAITLDTTGNKSIDTEFFLVTEEKLFYQVAGNQGEITLSEYDFTEDRKQSTSGIMNVVLFLFPSIFFYSYLAYLLKYLIIILVTGALGFLLARLFRNSIEFFESMVLSVYSATAMVAIEVLTIPFFIKDYLLTWTPFFGLHFSLIAITVYLTIYVSGVRLVGNRDVR